jgi:Type ISP C-terminal specificity domain
VELHIGGYRVCEKWLKDRKGRKLSKADVAHYQKIIVALAETIPLMQGIDDHRCARWLDRRIQPKPFLAQA